MKTTITISLIIIAISFGIGIYLYPQMPAQIPSHWNVEGEVDGYMPKFWGLFLMPIISLGLLLLFLVIPKIDPLKENIKKFRKYFNGFILLMILFLFYIYLLTIAWSFNIQGNMTIMMIPALAILFYYIGILTANAKRNWFIGIRTPWTLSSDAVWDKTHQLGGKLFKAAAVISLAGVLFGKYAIWFMLIPIIGVSIYTIIYSYVEFQKEKNGNKKIR